MNKTKYIILTIAICFSLALVVYPLRTFAITEYRCFNTGCAISAGGPYTTSDCGGKCVGHCLGNDSDGLFCLYTDSNPPTPICTSDSDCGNGGTTDDTIESSTITRYDCDTQNRKCIESSNGIYPSLSACEDICYRTPAMDNKYICDTLLQECYQDNINGNYQGLARCLDACVKQTAETIERYDCNTSTWQCEEVVDGRYSPLSSCEIICQPGGGLSCPGNDYCWACSQTTLQCYQSERGAYTSKFRCQAGCKLCIPKKYSCDTSTWTCKQDPNGGYPSKYLQLCKKNCVKPDIEQTIGKYSCDTSIYTCEEDLNGTYSSLLDCNSNCIEPITIRYSCNTSTWKCEEDYNGENSSLSKCQYNCVNPIIKRYSCNTSTGRCERDSYGAYTCSIKCNNNCAKKSPTASPPVTSPPPTAPPVTSPPPTSPPVTSPPPPVVVPRSGTTPPAGDPWNLDYWLKFWLGGFLRGIWE